ncbi:hypothetical protein [Mucilaginibacter sp. OK098]|uniref:hypothetical protein n=1 Tax=Mucilaginibacter sp. OK098 TaxID=1855297 RepID=UPI00092213BA|nr:hypothetical protein [Mucilaginibacter sp. OK098]SHN01452.1 hypothetical protein SAMN05216524_104569 [Mucilaginibacter sp. OK098]
MDVNINWNGCATIADGERYEIEGVNIWDFKWRATGDKFTANEPVRGLNYNITIYEITERGKSIRFGAAEVSNNVWIVYTVL